MISALMASSLRSKTKIIPNSLSGDPDFFIFTINPGSTSTTCGYFENDTLLWDFSIDHTQQDLPQPSSKQLPIRLKSILSNLPSAKPDAIAARGGPLKPLSAGIYEINDTMLEEFRNETYSNHASNLGALIAHELQMKWLCPAFIVDPVTVDDFTDVARLSGVPGIQRKSRSHALNIRHCYYTFCRDNNVSLEEGRVIVGHFGGGFSIAAVVGGKIIDVNDALLGMGPFSLERAGALPLSGLLSLIYSEDRSQEDITHLLSTSSGLKAYYGTSDFTIIEKKIKEDSLPFNAMMYQVAKEVGACMSVLHGNCDGIIITGGLAHSKVFVSDFQERCAFFAPITVYPGSFESEALASGVLRALKGTESVREYT